MNYLALLALLREAWRAIIAAFLLGCGSIASGLGLLTLSAYLISAAALHPPLSELTNAIVGVRFFSLSRAVCRYGERYFSHDAVFLLLEKLRVRCYQRLEALPWERFMAKGCAAWLVTVVEDVETLKEFYLRSVLPLTLAAASLAVLFLFLWPLGWLMPLLLAAAFGVSGILLPWLTKKRQEKSAEQLALRSKELREQLLGTVGALEAICAADRCAAQLKKLDGVSSKLLAAQRQSGALLCRGEALGHLGLQMTLLALLFCGAQLVADDALNGVYLASLLLGVQSIFESVVALPAAVYYLADSIAAWRRLESLPQAPLQSENEDAAGQAHSSLEVVAISYRHGDGAGIKDISFTLAPGRHVAIVGPSGAGKSTLLNVLLGFWTKQSGEFLLDGESVEALPTALFAAVPQAQHLFNAGLVDNVRLARPQASAAEIEAALAAARLDEVIAALPQGGETFVGALGKQLSGGERQRIAIARAFLKTAPFLVWDEATRGLDALLERELQAEFEARRKSSGLLQVTHRLTAGLENVDEIIVLDKGEIVERGRMPELLAQKGLFYELWRRQSEELPD